MSANHIGRITAFLVLAGIYMAIAGTVRYNLSVITAAISNQTPTFIIDAGHGGEDGGAVGINGAKESQINLSISKKLDYLLSFVGYDTKLIRDRDCSVYTEGTTLAEKKVSDLKERVKFVRDHEPAVLISIHQNHFSEERYSGAQVFYAKTKGSKELALLIQSSICDTLDPDNKRNIKEAESVYLMKQISCPGVLVECGFLSNHDESVLLQDPDYQTKLVCAITTALSQYRIGEIKT